MITRPNDEIRLNIYRLLHKNYSDKSEFDYAFGTSIMNSYYDNNKTSYLFDHMNYYLSQFKSDTTQSARILSQTLEIMETYFKKNNQKIDTSFAVKLIGISMIAAHINNEEKPLDITQYLTIYNDAIFGSMEIIEDLRTNLRTNFRKEVEIISEAHPQLYIYLAEKIQSLSPTEEKIFKIFEDKNKALDQKNIENEKRIIAEKEAEKKSKAEEKIIKGGFESKFEERLREIEVVIKDEAWAREFIKIQDEKEAKLKVPITESDLNKLVSHMTDSLKLNDSDKKLTQNYLALWTNCFQQVLTSLNKNKNDTNTDDLQSLLLTVQHTLHKYINSKEKVASSELFKVVGLSFILSHKVVFEESLVTFGAYSLLYNDLARGSKINKMTNKELLTAEQDFLIAINNDLQPGLETDEKFRNPPEPIMMTFSEEESKYHLDDDENSVFDDLSEGLKNYEKKLAPDDDKELPIIKESLSAVDSYVKSGKYPDLQKVLVVLHKYNLFYNNVPELKKLKENVDSELENNPLINLIASVQSREYEVKLDSSKTKAEEKDKDDISRKLNIREELQSLQKLENEYKINPNSVTQDSVVNLLERIKKINSNDNNNNPEYINVRDRIINLYADVCVKSHIDWDKADRRRNVVGGMLLGFFIGFVAGFLAGGIGALPGAIIGAIIGGGGGVGGGLAGYAATPFLNRIFGSSKQEHVVLRENLVKSIKDEFSNELSQNQTVGNSSTLSTAQGLTDQPGVLLERKENIKSSADTTPPSYTSSTTSSQPEKTSDPTEKSKESVSSHGGESKKSVPKHSR